MRTPEAFEDCDWHFGIREELNHDFKINVFEKASF